HTHSPFLSLSLSLTHTHTLSHTHTLTHYCTDKLVAPSTTGANECDESHMRRVAGSETHAPNRHDFFSFSLSFSSSSSSSSSSSCYSSPPLFPSFLSSSSSSSHSYPSPSLVVDLFKVLHCLPNKTEAQGTFMLQSSPQIAQPT